MKAQFEFLGKERSTRDNVKTKASKGRFWRGSLIVYYVGLILGLAVLWLVFVPPINLRSQTFCGLLIPISFAVIWPLIPVNTWHQYKKKSDEQNLKVKGKLIALVVSLIKSIRLLAIPLLLCVLFFVLNLFSHPILQSRNYANLIHKENGDFTADVAEIKFYDIPTVDRVTATRLGNKKMGEIPELVSQFEVAPDYTQINYQGKPVRVTQLRYGDLFKWFNNRSEGLPRLIRVDMTNGEVTLQEIKGGMKYSDSEPLFRNIKRHLRLKYPFTIMGEPQIEIDDDGNPYWIVPTESPKVGWFGGLDVTGVILCNAVDGSCEYYDVKDAPSWIDRVYPEEMVTEQLNYNGLYQSGWLNSLFGQKGVLTTTDGYNYLAINDDVYLYTGITSVAGDSSNLGFVLVNMRTKETKFYPVASADEQSARNSAEGAVQEKGYKATWPILLNIGSRPTYCMALKDEAELIKMYALVDAQDYQRTATATSIKEAIDNYQMQELANQPTEQTEPVKTLTKQVEVADITQVTIEGNTYYYMVFKQENKVFFAALSVDQNLPFIKPGDKLRVEYEESQSDNTPLRIVQIEH